MKTCIRVMRWNAYKIGMLQPWNFWKTFEKIYISLEKSLKSYAFLKTEKALDFFVLSYFTQSTLHLHKIIALLNPCHSKTFFRLALFLKKDFKFSAIAFSFFEKNFEKSKLFILLFSSVTERYIFRWSCASQMEMTFFSYSYCSS